MEAILEKSFDVLNIISEGGPKAIIAIICIFMAFVIFASYFVIRFIIKFVEKMNEKRDIMIEDKDNFIKERITRMEQLIDEYNKSHNESTEAIVKIEAAVHELSLIIQTYVSQRPNRRG